MWEAAFPGRAPADRPAVAALADSTDQWRCRHMRTLQTNLLALQDCPCESACERDDLREACGVFYKKTKHTDGWFWRQKPPHNPQTPQPGAPKPKPQPQPRPQPQPQNAAPQPRPQPRAPAASAAAPAPEKRGHSGRRRRLTAAARPPRADASRVRALRAGP